MNDNPMPDKPSVAFWFRYSPADSAELTHAMPAIWAELSKHCVVHFFGMKTKARIPEKLLRLVQWHPLPFTVNRASTVSKMATTALWTACLPFVAKKCRRMGIRAVFIDETIPFTARIALRHFGPNVAVSVADMFTDIYFKGPLAPLGRAILRSDIRSWRRLPLIFTRAKNTRDWLAEQGVSPERVCPAYDPCDFAIYHPVDSEARATVRASFSFRPGDVVLVNHGIAHPNKGNDRILHWLAPILPSHPEIKFLLIGDGPALPGLRRLARSLHVESACTFTGWLPTAADVCNALAASDIGLVMRSGNRSDDFHMTSSLVHDMACGLPVLGAGLAGISEVVREGHNGFLFPPDDGDAFRAALLRLAADPSLRKTLGANAHSDARREFDLPTFARDVSVPLLRLAGIHPDET